MTAVPTRVLVAGSGSIAKRHVRNLLELGVAEVMVVSARDLSPDPVFADGRIRAVPDIPDDPPPVAIVANDTDRHVAVTRRLVSAGAHVLVEKPLAVAVSDDVLALQREAEDAGAIVRVAYNLRFLPAIRRVRDLLAESALGRVLYARIEAGQWLPDWRPGRDFRASYSASCERGGGVGLDLSHELDYMRLLFGMPVRWRTAAGNTGALGVECDEVFEGVYTYEDALICGVHLDYLASPAKRRMLVVGSAGAIDCDIIGRRLVVERKSGTEVEESSEAFDVAATYVAELRSFFGEIEGESGGLATLADATDVLRLVRDPEEGGSHA